MTEVKLIESLAQFVQATTFDELPGAVVSSVKQRFLDTIGICLASAAESLGAGVADLIAVWGGREQAGLIGRAERYPAPNAALYNGTLAHSLDFDDTHLPSVLHPSASIVPATLAIAEAIGATGRDAIAAAAIGYEVCVRLGMAGYDPRLGNSIFFEKGWHATSICGALASAAIGAKLLKLDTSSVASAMGIAASMGSGLLEANRAGGSVKQLHCGWAAHSGITAALLAQRGYTAPPTILEGRFGFYTAFCDGKFFAGSITDGLGEHWVAPEIFFKPYPSNHFTHAAIDAAIAFKQSHQFSPDDIQAIELGAASAPLRTIGEPREQKIRPQSGYHARFSGPFAVATALLKSSGLGVSFENFSDDNARDPVHLALAGKVTTFVDPECEQIYPNQFPAVLRIHLKSGETWEKRVMVNRGGPGNPLSDEELFVKFKLNTERCLTTAQIARLAETIHRLDRLERIDEVMNGTRMEKLVP
jgi:2-methylcitrate dehydratase PrpD